MTKDKDPEDKGKTLENKDFEGLGLGDLANKLIIETLNYVNGKWPESSDYTSKEEYNEKLRREYIKNTRAIIEELNQREEGYRNKTPLCQIDL